MNIPQTVLTRHNTLLPLLAGHLSIKSVHAPLPTPPPPGEIGPHTPHLWHIKVLRGKAALLLHGPVFLLNDESGECVFLLSVSSGSDPLHSQILVPRQSQLLSMELAPTYENKQSLTLPYTL